MDRWMEDKKVLSADVTNVLPRELYLWDLWVCFFFFWKQQKTFACFSPGVVHTSLWNIFIKYIFCISVRISVLFISCSKTILSHESSIIGSVSQPCYLNKSPLWKKFGLFDVTCSTRCSYSNFQKIMGRRNVSFFCLKFWLILYGGNFLPNDLNKNSKTQKQNINDQIKSRFILREDYFWFTVILLYFFVYLQFFSSFWNASTSAVILSLVLINWFWSGRCCEVNHAHYVNYDTWHGVINR